MDVYIYIFIYAISKCICVFDMSLVLWWFCNAVAALSQLMLLLLFTLLLTNGLILVYVEHTVDGNT